jgi:NAD(P)-dependent dehydrogenase (short-subunit alcohol dehydrogenase family)
MWSTLLVHGQSGTRTTGGPTVRKEAIVVTGAGHGIGQATAELLAERGSGLVLADANEEWLATAAEACTNRGAEVLSVPFDQRSRESVDELFARTHERFGRIDGLANVVGIYPAQRIVDMSDEFWDNVIATNLTGLFYCCRAALSRMVETGGGSIVNVASILASLPREGLSAYSASKGGIEAFSRVLALEGAPTIRVNVVSPGPVLPAMPLQPVPSESSTRPDAAATAPHKIPLERAGQATEIAAGIAFLLSPQASFITGQILRINGGIHMA